MLCIQLLKSCSTPRWQTNKQNPCLFFSAQWLQQTHSASFRLARQLALLTKTNSMDDFFFVSIDLIIRVFHILTYFLTISQGIFLFSLLLFQTYEKMRNEGKNHEGILYTQKNCEINSFLVKSLVQWHMQKKSNSGNPHCHSNSDLSQSFHPGKVSLMLPRSHPNKIFQ